MARVRTPAGRGYVPIGEINLGGGIDCHSDTDDDTMITASLDEKCTYLRSYTPNYQKSADGTPAAGDPQKWSIHLPRGGQNGTPIEFLVADSASSDWHAALTGSQPLDFGVVLPDRPTTLTGALAVAAPPAAGFMVTPASLAISGTNAAAFSAKVHGPRAALNPFSVRPFGSLSIDVTVDPSVSPATQVTELQATLTISLAGGHPQQFVVPLHAVPLSGQLTVEPASLNFPGQRWAGQPLPWVANVLIANVGAQISHVSSLTVSDTANFSVAGPNGVGTAPQNTLPAGGSEIISVVFCPNGSLPTDALLGVGVSYDDPAGGPPFQTISFVTLHADQPGVAIPPACRH